MCQTLPGKVRWLPGHSSKRQVRLTYCTTGCFNVDNFKNRINFYLKKDDFVLFLFFVVFLGDGSTKFNKGNKCSATKPRLKK